MNLLSVDKFGPVIKLKFYFFGLQINCIFQEYAIYHT